MLILYDKQRTPSEFLVKAFVEAVRRNKTGLICESLTADLPLGVLKNGLDAAANPVTKNFIRDMCDQVSKEHA
ncbi:hypothetical protein DVH05_020764 [Phytophthora capsici]|nr:hypothetical protein DVH05_020764 [Phytophthora capsici]